MLVIPAYRKKLKFLFFSVLILLLAIATVTFGAGGPSASNNLLGDTISTIIETRHGFKNLFDSGLGFITNDLNILNSTSAAPDSTFTVDNNGDSVDINPGDGICADSTGNCTLRAAIQESNANVGTDAISFNLVNAATIQLNPDLIPAELTISDAVNITGPGARLITINGNSNTVSGIFDITTTGTAFTGISGVTIAGSGGRGVSNSGRLNLSDVNIRGNHTGIYNTGKLNLTRALVNTNTDSGIYLNETSITEISNTTITNNTSSDFGGGIQSLSADVTLNNVTISHNTAATSGGGFYYDNTVSGVFVRNTIIANNTAPNGPDVFSVKSSTGAKFTSRGNNLIGKSADDIGFVNNAASDEVGTIAAPVDPLLGALQNNGGQTDTRAFSNASPAKDAGNMCVINLSCSANNPSAALLTDQRGNEFPRFFEASVDIGAFEAFYPVPTISSLVPNNYGTGRGAFELIVNGSKFVADSVVQWNGQNRATTFISNTQLKVQILASDVATAGQYPVTVVNPQPGGGTSEAVNFVVADCSYTLNPTSKNFTVSGGTATFTVNTLNGCAWTAVSNDSFITINAGSASGTGSGTVTFSVTANTGIGRTGTITAGGKTFTVTQDSGCVYVISPVSATVTAAGGTGSVAVTANAGCPWTAAVGANSSFITITSGASGSGSGTVGYTVAANTGPARTGTLTIAGKTFTITQADGCVFTINPTAVTIAAAGGAGSFSINSGAGCAWTAVSNDSFITINAGSASGSGSGTVSFSVTANTGIARTGTITAGGKTFTVTQDNGCVYAIDPVSAAVGAAGGTGSVAVTANAGCPWTAAVGANSSFITITSGASGSGSGTVGYTVAANTGPARTGTLTIAGKTFTITQANGCTYSLSPTGITVNESGGSSSFTITTGAGCIWTAVSNDAFISITNGLSGTGNGTVTFTVAANTGDERTGTITAGGETFTVNQVNLIVTNLNDSGPGSLRRAVTNANNVLSNDVVIFQPTLSGTITLTSGEIVVINKGSLEIKGPGANVLTVSGNNNSRIFYNDSATIKISELTLTGGNGVGKDSSDTNKYGGAIYSSDGSLTLDRVHLKNNIIIVPNQPGFSGVGGGIYINQGTNNIIQNSTVSGNKSSFAAGIYNQGQLYIVNSTITGNVSNKDAGGILSVGATTLKNVTVTENATLGAAPIGGGVDIAGGVFSFSNSIIAGNTGPEISFISGNVTSGGNNLIGDEPGDSANTINTILYKPTDILNTPPLLGILSLYGGTTPTKALLPDSPAINKGSTENVTATDQRGSRRIVGESVDIGAYEFNITVMPTALALPNGSINSLYLQDFSAFRASGANSNDQFTYSIVDGTLPNGITLSSNGRITGVPSVGGNFIFTVKAIGEDGMAGINKYNLLIACDYSISPTTSTFNASGGTGTVNITTTAGCPWTATSSVSWITFTSNTSGSGNGAVNFTVAANLGVARTGTITIGGKTLTITQNGGCSFTVNPTSKSFGASGGTGNFALNASDSGCPWSVTSNDSWITITSNSSGNGNTTVNYTVAANAGQTRSGTITAGGKTFTVMQSDSCVYTLSAASVNVSAASSTGSFTVNTTAGCSWTAVSNVSWIAIVSGGSGTATGTVNFSVMGNPGAARVGTITAGGQTFTVNQAGNTVKHVAFDFDGDGKSDISVFRPSNGIWYIKQSTNGYTSFIFGQSGDKPISADYDGDGKTDIAVYRSGIWYLQRSSLGFAAIAFGAAEDIPQPADFDGDGNADIAVFRPSNGVWYVYNLTKNQNSAFAFGQQDDKPVVGDYDGDGLADYAVYRAGIWYLQRTTQGFLGYAFGASDDQPVAADYDGDGKTDLAVFRQSNGVWYEQRSTLGFGAAAFGFATDLPTPADYDGDGKADIAVFRPSNGVWYLQQSTDGFLGIGFGESTDKPIPNSYIP